MSRPTDGLRLVWMVRDGWGRVRRGGGGGHGSINRGCSTDRGATFAYNGYAYVDLGSCPTIAICNAKAAAYNTAASGADMTIRAVCGLSRADPDSHGRHLFLRDRLSADVVPLGSDVEAESAAVESLMTV